MVKRLILVTLTGALLAVTFSNAFAGDRGKDNQGRASRRKVEGRDHAVVRRADHYFGPRDVVVVREYYRPYHRPLAHGVRHVYVRNGYLPYGWERRVRPVPVYVERELVPLPYGYSRSIIDGQLVVHNGRGLIVDVAVLF
jgi:hypothetical protein